MEKVYKATNGAPFNKKKVQLYGRELDRIKQDKGVLRPKDVVEAAKSRRSPLHDVFEWDNTEAAERYRLYQARALINHIDIEIRYDHKVKEQKAFFSVQNTPDEENKNIAYVTFEDVLSKPELRKQIILKALDEAQYWEERYQEYKELQKIVNAIELTNKKLRKRWVKKPRANKRRK